MHFIPKLKKMLKEIEHQTADLTKAIQIGVEEVTRGGSNKLTEYLKSLIQRE